MEQLISRQAAIDALNEVVKDHSITDFDAIASILDLPPAQPESNYDEWCTDCKEYDHENSCCPRWTKVIRQTRRELQDEFVMTAVDGTLWVTVDDVQKVGRVIVDEDKSKFCRQFYMDAKPEPCEDAVSRTAVQYLLAHFVDEDKYVDACDGLKHLPPVTPKQRTGKWIDGIIPNDGGGLPVIVCDQCNTFFPLQFGDGHKFCPNCGAKMDEDRDYEHAVEQLEHNMTFEPTYNPEDGSM